MNEIVCLALEKLKTAHRNTWLYFRTIDNNFEETLIKTLVEFDLAEYVLGETSAEKVLISLYKTSTNLVNYNTNSVSFLLTPYAILYKYFK